MVEGPGTNLYYNTSPHAIALWTSSVDVAKAPLPCVIDQYGECENSNPRPFKEKKTLIPCVRTISTKRLS